MKAILSKSATGNIRSKILDPKYHTVELVLEVQQSPTEFAKLVEEFTDKEFSIDIKD